MIAAEIPLHQFLEILLLLLESDNVKLLIPSEYLTIKVFTLSLQISKLSQILQGYIPASGEKDYMHRFNVTNQDSVVTQITSRVNSFRIELNHDFS